MNTIIAGRFDAQARAEAAALALEAKGFPRDQIATFFVNPPGQHDTQATRLDPESSAGAHHAGAGAASGALGGTGIGTVVGLATMPVLGPVSALAGAAIGGYVGSLVGALEKMGDGDRPTGEAAQSQPVDDEAIPRKSGMLVAVGAASASEQERAISVLREQGAADVERSQGSIAGSQWNDFDPLSTPALVSSEA